MFGNACTTAVDDTIDGAMEDDMAAAPLTLICSSCAVLVFVRECAYGVILV